MASFFSSFFSISHAPKIKCPTMKIPIPEVVIDNHIAGIWKETAKMGEPDVW
jgi:hypothetical protein